MNEYVGKRKNTSENGRKRMKNGRKRKKTDEDGEKRMKTDENV